MQPWSLAALVRTTAHLCTTGDKKGSILRKYDHLRVGVVEPQACPAIQLLRVAHRCHSLVTPEQHLSSNTLLQRPQPKL